MTKDPRCCGSGTCIIDTDGRCWCGHQWDGQKRDRAPFATADDPGRVAAAQPPFPASRSSS